MANLLVETGNTALKAAWAEGSTLGKTFRYQGEKMMDYLLSLLEKDRPEVLTVASAEGVSPEEEEILRGRCGHLLILDRAHTNYLLRYNLPEYLSYDRAAELIAAGFSPGCRTRFKALERYSKSLPLVDTPEKILPEGHSLTGSVESGVISGIMFEIEGYIRRRPDSIVIFTGGDAIYFAKRMKNSIFVVCNLVLMGLALITDDYVEKNLK